MSDLTECSIFHDLTAEQADGRACIDCGTDFTVSTVAAVPVGTTASGSQVFACDTHDRGEATEHTPRDSGWGVLGGLAVLAVGLVALGALVYLAHVLLGVL